jgi:undecaprenyl-diphosphatase
MSWLEAIILGILQGLTEFLPVSSSGHLTLAKELFGIDSSNLSFEVAVHAATVLSTIVVFRKTIWDLIKGFFKFQYNAQTDYLLKIGVSMIPILIVGVFFKDYVEQIFGSGALVVGIMLIVTACLLSFSDYMTRKREKLAGDGKEIGKEVGYKEAIIIGIAQSIAVLPGLSRSGTTIATGLICGVKKSAMAQFSFLMVLIPILGEAFLELMSGEFAAGASGISAGPLAAGFLAAFISGFLACKWMINIVRKAKLVYFAIYCAAAGILSIVLSVC